MNWLLAAVVSSLVLAPALAASASPGADSGASSDEGAVSSWLDEALARAAASQGLDGIAWSDVEAVRVTTSPSGVTSTETLTGLAARDSLVAKLEESGLLGARTQEQGAVPDVVVGNLLLHYMIQFGRCEGYDKFTVLENLAFVGGRWDMGLHAVLSPTVDPAGGGLDLGDVQGGLTQGVVAHSDTNTSAVGSIFTDETYITIFGICLATFGLMIGDGVFTFDVKDEPLVKI